MPQPRDALDLLVQLAGVDAGSGVIVHQDDPELAELLSMLLQIPGAIDRHVALGAPPAWHVLVLPHGRRLAIQHSKER